MSKVLCVFVFALAFANAASLEEETLGTSVKAHILEKRANKSRSTTTGPKWGQHIHIPKHITDAAKAWQKAVGHNPHDHNPHDHAPHVHNPHTHQNADGEWEEVAGYNN